jgi:hypothetical protein
MERIKAANAKATIDLRIHISLFVDVFSAASATIGRPQTELVFSSNARPPKGTIAAFDFTDVGTLRPAARQRIYTILCRAGRGAMFDSH